MSSNETPRQSPKNRRRIIKGNIATKTIKEIALMCGCESRTIDRDIENMKATGEWWDWLEYEFLRLHNDVDISKDNKYREIGKLYAKQFIKEKTETNVQGDINLKWINHDEPNTDDTVQST